MSLVTLTCCKQVDPRKKTKSIPDLQLCWVVHVIALLQALLSCRARGSILCNTLQGCGDVLCCGNQV